MDFSIYVYTPEDYNLVDSIVAFLRAPKSLELSDYGMVISSDRTLKDKVRAQVRNRIAERVDGYHPDYRHELIVSNKDGVRRFLFYHPTDNIPQSYSPSLFIVDMPGVWEPWKFHEYLWMFTKRVYLWRGKLPSFFREDEIKIMSDFDEPAA